MALLHIPKDGNKELTKDSIESYGKLSYEVVKRHSETYVNLETRSAQDSVMLYICIMASLTEAGQKKVRSRGLTYPFMSGDKGVGTLLLKVVVVMVAHVDTCGYKGYGYSSQDKALFTRQDHEGHGFRH